MALQLVLQMALQMVRNEVAAQAAMVFRLELPQAVEDVVPVVRNPGQAEAREDQATHEQSTHCIAAICDQNLFHG